MSIFFSEADPKLWNERTRQIDRSKLTPAQQHILDNSNKEIDPEMKKVVLDSAGIQAQYQIHVMFDDKRRTADLTHCLITCWRGDELLYLCRHQNDPTWGCGMPFLEPPKAAIIDGGIPIKVYQCRNCPTKDNRYRLVRANVVSSFALYKLPAKRISEVVYDYFRALNRNTDILVKHIKTSYEEGPYTKRDGDYVLYPLRNIIKDTNNDSMVLKKIEQFLSA